MKQAEKEKDKVWQNELAQERKRLFFKMGQLNPHLPDVALTVYYKQNTLKHFLIELSGNSGQLNL